jgi:phosphomannomutase / phosphoglucomutase
MSAKTTSSVLKTITRGFRVLNPNIFREYDIRGVVEKDLTPEVVIDVGRAFATEMVQAGYKRLSLGRDGRLSSPKLHDSLVQGLLSTGVEILDIGICPTPLLYFSLFELPVQGGVMITGSHNPADFNGFKLCRGRETIYGESIQQIRRRIESKAFIQGKGQIKDYPDIIKHYINYLSYQFKNTAKDIKVIMDSGNGTGGQVAPDLIRQMGCQVIELYSELDGRFPNHHPDPTVPENLVDLIARVKAEQAAMGIGFDGDADRLGVVDENGEVLWGDRLLTIFARDILKRQPNATVVSEVKCSQQLFDDVAQRGGHAIMWKAGHSLIKAKMREAKAVLAGEMSGHFCFADRYYGYDDAIYAACRLIEIVAKTNQPLSRILSDLPKTYSTPEIRVDCPDEIKFKLVEKVKQIIGGKFKMIDVDGLRIQFEDGWGLLRASNTQPVLVLRFEAKTRERLEEIQALIQDAVKQAQADL